MHFNHTNWITYVNIFEQTLHYQGLQNEKRFNIKHYDANQFANAQSRSSLQQFCPLCNLIFSRLIFMNFMKSLLEKRALKAKHSIILLSFIKRKLNHYQTKHERKAVPIEYVYIKNFLFYIYHLKLLHV